MEILEIKDNTVKFKIDGDLNKEYCEFITKHSNIIGLTIDSDYNYKDYLVSDFDTETKEYKCLVIDDKNPDKKNKDIEWIGERKINQFINNIKNKFTNEFLLSKIIELFDIDSVEYIDKEYSTGVHKNLLIYNTINNVFEFEKIWFALNLKQISSNVNSSIFTLKITYLNDANIENSIITSNKNKITVKDKISSLLDKFSKYENKYKEDFLYEDERYNVYFNNDYVLLIPNHWSYSSRYVHNKLRIIKISELTKSLPTKYVDISFKEIQKNLYDNFDKEWCDGDKKYFKIGKESTDLIPFVKSKTKKPKLFDLSKYKKDECLFMVDKLNQLPKEILNEIEREDIELNLDTHFENAYSISYDHDNYESNTSENDSDYFYDTITLFTNRFYIILEGGRYIKDQSICDFHGLQQFEIYKR